MPTTTSLFSALSNSIQILMKLHLIYAPYVQYSDSDFPSADVAPHAESTAF